PGQCVTAPTVVQLQSGTFALPALASGQTYQITVTANVTAISGSVSNIATVAVPGGTTDSNLANNSAIDTDTVNSATITVTKISNGGIGSFSFTGDNGFANQTIATVTAGVGVAGATQTLTAAGAITTITESAPPAGFVLASISCSGLGAGGIQTPDIVARNVVLDAAATAAGAAIACTFTNVAVVPNSITIVKSTVGGNGTFAYTGTNGIAGFNITTASGSGSNAITALALGSYTINETPVPAGWNLTNLQCLGAATPAAITGGQAVITLAAGEAVVCTYTNTKQGSITIVKNTVGGDSTFNYTGAQSFSITTAGGTGSNTSAFASVVPGTYNVTETVPAGWNLTGLTCSNGSTVTVGTATANVAVAAGEAVTCTFTNNLLLPLSAAGIPTLSEWAMIMLAALLSITGFVAMRRQAR
ncbi:MAG: IPTL-CTERM sorting domain-containing protein, partial [Gallionella sp.]|nr:IPTL-CTERM sorting domain-containing protein [Gallionella sp.]